MKNNDRFENFDDEVRELVLDFERTVMHGESQFYDADELEMIIDYYLEVNDLVALTKAVVYAERLYPANTSIKLRRAHLLIANKQYTKALEMLLHLQEAEPDNTDISYSLGVAYGAMDDPRSAIKHYLRAATDGWQVGRIYANVAEEYDKLEEYDKAVNYYERSLDLEPSDNITLYNYVDLCSAEGMQQRAVAYLQKFVKKNPYTKEGWQGLGMLYDTLRQYDEAIDAYEFALAIDPSFWAAYADLAATQEATGQVGDAATTLLRSVDYADDRSSVFVLLAGLYGRNENLEMSILYARKAVEANPDNALAHSTLALGLLQVGDGSATVNEVERALRLAPDSPDVLAAAAHIFDQLGDADRAENYYDILISTECTENQYIMYAEFLARQQRWADLMVFCQEMLNLYPHHLDFSTYLAAAFFNTGRYNRARNLLRDSDFNMLLELCPTMEAWINESNEKID